ncbi:MAG TPA: tryptophan synthase subunit alpha [Nitrospina sp.]|nr:tryptophan synthase subunit alpha [Nitrospinaceae bacterium]HCG72175.1 tryptophan synthase subunit alpha [Nitrospina sp.]
MSRIEKRLVSLNGNKALVAFYTAGDPDLSASKDIFAVIEKNGADIIEIGVPFSDPLADGPTIQASSHRSLQKGTTLKKIIQLVADIRKTSELPIILMTSFNPVFVYGKKEFVADAVKAGVDGMIIPDLPPEEAEEFLGIAEGLDLVFLLAPTSTPARIQQVGKVSKGFIYYISLTGTTGTKEALSAGLKNKVNEIKKSVSLPVLVGFGVSGPEQAKQAAEASDGVIIGSAIVKLIAEHSDPAERDRKLADFLASIKKAINP